MNSLKAGDMIPDFSLPDQNGKMFHIRDVIGKKNMVVFFYPRDGSLYCTREACYFRDINDVFDENEAVVIGISGQSVESHKEFAEINRLNFTLLSDTDDKVRKLFGVPSHMFGLVAGRVTYVADKSGRIIYVFKSQTQVQKHADEALKIILLLKKTRMADAQ
ncbi:MAG: peroxiredoxin [Bacteroidales bacterium]|jgi:peroxiredoxin Q/BCP|nr:peroxiredoxin [Bacteroidales bacterium]